MKKILFIVISILLFINNSKAQTIIDSKLVDSFQIEYPVRNVLTAQLQNQNIAVAEHKQVFYHPYYTNFTVSIYTTEGVKLNTRTYSFNNIGYVADMNVMSNGEIVILSVSNNYNTLLFLDTLGNQLRTKSYTKNPNFTQPHINKLYPTLDNNIMVIAQSISNGITEYSADINGVYSADVTNILFKLDNQGNLIWQKSFNSYYFDKFVLDPYSLPYLFTKIDFLPNTNNEFNLIKNNKINNDSVSIELERIDGNGNTLWTKTIGKYNKHLSSNMPDGRQAESFNFLTTKDYIYTNITFNSKSYPYSYDYYMSTLYKYDKEGNELNQSFSGNFVDIVFDSRPARIKHLYFKNAMTTYKIDDLTLYCNAIYGNDLLLISNTTIFYFYNGIDYSNFNINMPNRLLAAYDISINTHKLNDSTLLYIDYISQNGNDIGKLYFNTLTLNTRAINYEVYIDTDNNQQLSANDERPETVYIETNQNNVSNIQQINNGNSFLSFEKGTLISKFSTYLRRNHLYTATPVIDTNNYNPNKIVDTVYFRLTKIPNLQDLEVYITPTLPARPGFATTYRLHAENIGSKTIKNIQVKFLKDTKQTVSTNPNFETPSLISNDTLIWNIDSLVSNQTKDYFISCTNDTTLTTADTLHLFAAITPFENDTFINDNTFILNQNVVNSFDPNDKLEAHGAGITTQQFNDGDFLYYTIRFQNTGNSYATKIKIIDTLSAFLDVNTLELLSSSHSFDYSITNNNIITWKNDNMYLPDSTTDEPNSHGYVSFRIKPKTNFTTNDNIQNRAHIYFDYNTPVITNTTSTVILQERTTAIKQNNAIPKIKLFPSPTNGNLQLQFDISNNKNISLQIIDINGKIMQQQNLQPNVGFNSINIDLSAYTNGIYFIQLYTDNEQLYYGKVLKQ